MFIAPSSVLSIYDISLERRVHHDFTADTNVTKCALYCSLQLVKNLITLIPSANLFEGSKGNAQEAFKIAGSGSIGKFKFLHCRVHN